MATTTTITRITTTDGAARRRFGAPGAGAGARGRDFFATLSLARMPVDPTQPSPPRRRSDAARARPKPVVLLVDDDETMRVLARHLLQEGGYDVVESESGRDALAQLRGGPLPDYLVTDLKMADGSGGWLVSQVGYEFPALLARTVVITGAAASASAAHVAARWRCPVVAKPFTGPELVAALRGRGGASGGE